MREDRRRLQHMRIAGTIGLFAILLATFLGVVFASGWGTAAAILALATTLIAIPALFAAFNRDPGPFLGRRELAVAPSTDSPTPQLPPRPPRHQMAYSTRHTNTRPSTALRRIEPAFSPMVDASQRRVEPGHCGGPGAD